MVYVAARDQRVKALVSQVSPVGWPNSSQNQWLLTGGERARGTRGYPDPFKRAIGSLRGDMIWERLALFNPREDASRLKRCASLFLVAEHEELFNNDKTALVAHQRIPAPSKYVVIPGATHYSIYDGAGLTTAINEAITWFEEHLR